MSFNQHLTFSQHLTFNQHLTLKEVNTANFKMVKGLSLSVKILPFGFANISDGFIRVLLN